MRTKKNAPAAGDNGAEQDKFSRAITVSIQADHHFTDSEKLELGKNLSAKIRDKEGLAAHKSEIMAQINAQVKEVDAAIQGLSAKLSSGFETRPMDALCLFGDPKKGQKTFYHPETRAVIRTEQMLASDYEQELPNMPPPQKKPAADPAPVAQKPDNQNAGTTPLGEALHAAAKGKDLPRVDMILDEGYNAERALGIWRKAAKKQKWPAPAIDLIDEECRKAINNADTEDEATKRVHEILSSHVTEQATA